MFGSRRVARHTGHRSRQPFQSAVMAAVRSRRSPAGARPTQPRTHHCPDVRPTTSARHRKGSSRLALQLSAFTAFTSASS
jgi:hypothetical protein